MTIKELLRQYMNGSITYGEVREKLKKMSLSHEDIEHYETMLDNLRELYETSKGNDRDPRDWSPRPLKAIPNEFAHEILIDTIKQIKNGMYPMEVGNHLYNNYGIDGNLCTYFYNEAFDLVRLWELSEENIEQIGEVYMHNKMQEMLQNGSLVLLPEQPRTRQRRMEGPPPQEEKK